MVKVSFFGVRGSTPCDCAANHRYGGNTSCVVIDGDEDTDPIVLDLGTGLRFWGLQAGRPDFRATALVSHLHWDHVQGLPFFTPIHAPDAQLAVFGPLQDGGVALGDAFDTFVNPPYFPVGLDGLAGKVTFTGVESDVFHVGNATVTSRSVPHVGPTLGYRIELGGVVMTYISDHQQPGCGATRVDDAVLELCAGADLLIHDAQYTPEEFARRSDWGHCTVEYAVEVAAQAGVRELCLFHHDPSHGDDQLDELTLAAARLAADRGVDSVRCAHEGLSITY